MFYTIVRIGDVYECHCSGTDRGAVERLQALESCIGAKSEHAASWMHGKLCGFETVHRAEFVGVPQSYLQERAWKIAARG